MGDDGRPGWNRALPSCQGNTHHNVDLSKASQHPQPKLVAVQQYIMFCLCVWWSASLHICVCECVCVFCLQLPVEVVPQDRKERFYLQTSPETTPLDRPVSTLYLYPENSVSSYTYTNTHTQTHPHKHTHTQNRALEINAIQYKKITQNYMQKMYESVCFSEELQDQSGQC